MGPAADPHRNQPPAQVLLAAAPGTSAAGTTTVRPSVTIVVRGGAGGHDVVWQSRPVWQHPPPADAKQA